jgi:hypothetical protein
MDRRRPSPLTAELKDFIDRAIVPALVETYLAEAEQENKLAVKPLRAAHSQRKTAVTLRRPRP